MCYQKENGTESRFQHMFNTNAMLIHTHEPGTVYLALSTDVVPLKLILVPCAVLSIHSPLLRSILLINTSFTNNWLKLWSCKISPNFDSNLLSINIQKV